jgi:hypothetical protein
MREVVVAGIAMSQGAENLHPCASDAVQHQINDLARRRQILNSDRGSWETFGRIGTALSKAPLADRVGRVEDMQSDQHREPTDDRKNLLFSVAETSPKLVRISLVIAEEY